MNQSSGNSFQRAFTYHERGTITVGLFFLAVLFASALVLALGARPDTWHNRLLTSRTLRLFGRHSYALYVLHQAVIAVAMIALERVERFRPPTLEKQLLLYFVGILGSLAASLVTWYLYEDLFLRLKKHFPTQRTKAS